MNTTPPEAPAGTPGPTGTDAGQGPRATRAEIRDLGRLRRSASDRKVAGVAGGLARHLDVDPLVLRVTFVVLALFGGAGLLLYGACWLMVPDEATGEAPVTLDERSRTVALLVVGVLAAFALVGDSWGVFWFPWPLAIIALVVWLLLTRKDRDQRPPGSGGAPYGPAHDAAYEPGPGATATTAYPHAGGPTWAGPVPPAPRPTPRDPRRRGPILFWFTLALVALGVGVLGMVDVAGVSVTESAYPALAVGIVGVMLLVGAFYGRAGGLILLGLLTAGGLAIATVVDDWESETIRATPTTASGVQDAYDLGGGELRLDLTEVTDPENLDDRTIHLEGGAGQIQVIVPDGVDVQVDATVGGPGNIQLFGTDRGGISTEWTERFDNGDVADLTIRAELGVGEIIVNEE